MRLGLRIDVDTYRGTRDGVPRLLELLRRHGIQASIFFSVGPDNMGRHLWRLARPSFLLKMMRSNAPGLYGWDILLRGTLWPGTVIGERLADVIKAADDDGHEIGLHAWDHHAWQMRIERMDAASMAHELRRGFDLLTQVIGRPPTCSAAPGWKCNAMALAEKARLPFEYNSDCRGSSVFLPELTCEAPAQPQVPTTLPTYDEVIDHDGITDDVYNDYILSLLEEDRLNVLTIHAEVEGIARACLFERFLTLLARNDIQCVTLGQLARSSVPAPGRAITPGTVPGREGWVAFQAEITDGRRGYSG
ncbi:MAG: 4-deoxy-4-formamido-L-arabinose-phosphoundecaprenol deformylase [Victivallales bacterium]|jgi:undecaprenyl phosphate-alpha-L-ara4FN deformylase|nr:4-deoxy-4-formamido-L-arabinose-phosphoundecaprenol deformylase [Lentisphaerota bacterium]MBT7057747.1 4-deoxy-4-formamido-L-arabinose-phosphoundecaprenol deformylase [Lentisphaerota bacterium]MBT7304767.1 4-deoxy-4-formamido-L-arabinose-phosphoundecaprenol deformylase [Victivallales bacterium]